MRLIKRLRNGKSVLGTIDKVIENTGEIVKKTTIDRDKFSQLEHDLQKIRAELLLSGKGGSITKITICGLVAAIVVVALIKFITNPADLIHFKDLAISVTPLMGMLIGSYATGTSIQRLRKHNDK